MLARIALILIAAIGLGACDSSVTLSVVNGGTVSDRVLIELLTQATRDFGMDVRLQFDPDIAGTDAALTAVEDRRRDLAIATSSPDLDRADLRTVAPLYSSVLHIAVRPGNSGSTLREVLNGASVFTGDEQSASRRLLEYLRSIYTWQDVSFNYVARAEDDPDVVFTLAPISPDLVPMLEGYQLFSLGRPADLGNGSQAEGLTLVAPMLRPFVIPEGTYGSLTTEPIVTVAIDTFLVGHKDIPDGDIYDLLQMLEAIGPRLAASRNGFVVDEVDAFDFTSAAFPLHTGTLKFRVRNAPGFIERATGLFEAATAVLAALGTALIAVVRHYRRGRKARIDELYARALDIRRNVDAGQRTRQQAHEEIRALQEQAFTMLIREELDPNDSFRILQDLVGTIRAELEHPEPTRPSVS